MLRIEIYEPMTDTQIELARSSIALILDIPAERIIVETLPDQEDDDVMGEIVVNGEVVATVPVDPADDALREPEEDDWFTADYLNWLSYLTGKTFILDNADNWPAEMKAKMETDQWWPNLWYLGERGDWNLLDVQAGKFANE